MLSLRTWSEKAQQQMSHQLQRLADSEKLLKG
jgi:hypothetical protein